MQFLKDPQCGHWKTQQFPWPPRFSVGSKSDRLDVSGPRIWPAWRTWKWNLPAHSMKSAMQAIAYTLDRISATESGYWRREGYVNRSARHHLGGPNTTKRNAKEEKQKWRHATRKLMAWTWIRSRQRKRTALFHSLGKLEIPMKIIHSSSHLESFFLTPFEPFPEKSQVWKTPQIFPQVAEWSLRCYNGVPSPPKCKKSTTWYPKL